MTNLDHATTIRRTVANKAYDLLKNCRDPQAIYDGKYDDYYIQEHWEVDPIELEQEVAETLPDEWFEEDEEDIYKKIRTNIEVHLDSKEYQRDKDRVRREYYQYQRDQKDLTQTNRAHQPTWRP